MRLPKILTVPPVHFRNLIERYSDEERHDLVRALDGIIQTAAIARGYVNERQGYDRGHSKAVKAANRLLTKARRILNYTYPASAGITF